MDRGLNDWCGKGLDGGEGLDSGEGLDGVEGLDGGGRKR